jgi:hypothetical protein
MNVLGLNSWMQQNLNVCKAVTTKLSWGQNNRTASKRNDLDFFFFFREKSKFIHTYFFVLCHLHFQNSFTFLLISLAIYYIDQKKKKGLSGFETTFKKVFLFLLWVTDNARFTLGTHFTSVSQEDSSNQSYTGNIRTYFLLTLGSKLLNKGGDMGRQPLGR